MLRRKHCSAKGHAIKTAIPYGMEKVEYLESSGTQYILSDLICKGYIKASSKFMSLSDGNGFIFGYQTTPNLNQCGILINSQTWNGLSLFHTLDAHFFTNIETYKIYNVDFSSQECVLNGIDLSKTVNDLRIVERTGDIALFARNEDVFPRHFLTGRIYYVKITNQEGESTEMIPILDRTGTPCMFDLVSRKNFYNSGTGQFIYPTTSTTYSLRSPQAEWAKMTDTGVHKIYHTPIGYDGSLEDYAIENGYKRLNETESPNEDGKYYSFKWVETDDTLTTEWFEVDPPQEEFIEENLDNPTE